MRVALFVPCFVDQFAPGMARATLEVLAAQGVEASYPRNQTCCGQPAWNAGLPDAARPLARHFARTFADFDYVVAPSASCVAMVRRHYAGLLGRDSGSVGFDTARVFELCEFLWEVLGVREIEGRFPHRVGLHVGCHGLRELGLGNASERIRGRRPDPIRRLLESLAGIEIVDLARPDECCGFGGTFAVGEPEMSAQMGRARLADHAAAGAEVLVSADPSCLLHLGGLIERQARAWPVLHVAEVLAGHAWPRSQEVEGA